MKTWNEMMSLARQCGTGTASGGRTRHTRRVGRWAGRADRGDHPPIPCVRDMWLRVAVACAVRLFLELLDGKAVGHRVDAHAGCRGRQDCSRRGRLAWCRARAVSFRRQATFVYSLPVALRFAQPIESRTRLRHAAVLALVPLGVARRWSSHNERNPERDRKRNGSRSVSVR